MTMSFARLADAYVEAIQASLPRSAEEIARLIAQAFQQKTRHIVDYAQTPPWDDSGEIIDTGMPFILENYPTVADFWEEYAGYREPSFESGRGWNYPTFGMSMQQELYTLLAPFYQEALLRLAHEEPQYYQQLVTYLQQEYDDQVRTTQDVYQGIAFTDIVGDTIIQCEIAVSEHVQSLPLAPLLQGQTLPRRCQRTLLEQIDNLPAFMDELAGYCATVAHVTSLTDDDMMQMHLERTSAGVAFGQHEGARELLMDHIARTGSLILRCDVAAPEPTGQALQDVRGWFIEADATRITPNRVLPDDLYVAMNTDAETGAKLPPEPSVRYL